ncbi:HNH endonuclease signature motif containing protein [Brachybacterium kimchii]|uniref:HNH endonuclease n=1 Tax=Brachybacterium kimchii TaxID=2942909 RepID=A0ABY4N7Q0_9MICO|nr:HNH endonuclease signature motif containing protein [Brachybacterium kimchii]UQN29453.1 HNH endonuclease [Brachybacterium kimchii]
MAAAHAYVEDEDGCYVSTYSVGSHGYAQKSWAWLDDEGVRHSATTTAHRAAWTYWQGPIPGGLTIDHLCKNRRCVRREHLRMVTNHENARRTAGRDWPLGECLHGHPNSELVLRSGRLRCRVCERERQRTYRARRAARTTT